MKRFLGLIFLTTFISASIFAVEFGGLISSDSLFDKQGSNNFVFTERLDTSAYLKVPFSKDGKINLATEFMYRLQIADSNVNHFLNLPLLKFNYAASVGTGTLNISAGRFTMTDNTSRIFNQTSDGLYVSYGTSTFAGSFYAGYTGLVNRHFVSMKEDGIESYNGFSSDVYTSSLPYLATAANLSLPNILFEQNLGFGFWGFFGIQNLKSNKYYGSINIDGPIFGGLYYAVDGVFAGISQENTTKFAGYTSAKFSYYFGLLGLTANAGLSFASEDFQTVTATSDIATGTQWSNTLVPTMSVSILPLPSLFIGAEATVPLTAKDMQYQGTGLIGVISYQFFSDMSVGLNVTQYFAKETSNSKTQLSIKASISF